MNYVWAFLFVPIYQVYWKISRIESHLTGNWVGERKRGEGERKVGKFLDSFDIRLAKKLSYPFFLFTSRKPFRLILTNCFSIFHDKQSRKIPPLPDLLLNRFWTVFFCQWLLFIVYRHRKSHLDPMSIPVEAENAIVCSLFLLLLHRGWKSRSSCRMKCWFNVHQWRALLLFVFFLPN